MAVALPDPIVAARQEAQWLNANRESCLVTAIDRVLTDAPWVQRQALIAGLDEFHAERMSKVPSAAKYPESPVWVQHTVALDRELQRAANLTNSELAIYRSLNSYIAYRGFAQAARQVATDEKCRVAYIPDSDRGRLHFKNVDDPLKHWKPDYTPPAEPPHFVELASDGVGSGLHMDKEPEELFPLRPLSMMQTYCNDVPSAVEFLTRYSPFWSGCNILLHDRQKRSAAIEKCSANFIEVFHPGPDGRSHISGMTCRDPNSPQGKHQTAMRQGYLKAFNIDADCADNAFWGACRKFEEKLSAGIRDLGANVKFADVVKLFTTQWPEGLNKAGLRIHPKQGLVGYTLMVYGMLLDERTFYRWQRSQDGKSFPSEPEVFKFPIKASSAA